MIRKLFIGLLVSSLLFASCTEKEKDQEQDRDKSFSWIVSNDELKEQILEYFQTVDTGDNFQNNVLYLGVSMKDSSCLNYSITYITSASFFVGGYTHMIIDIEGHPVCVYFNCEDPFFPSFKLSNESIIKLMKTYYPEEYRYFKMKVKDLGNDPNLNEDNFQLNTVFPPPTTWAPEIWELTFKDGKMIDKRVER
ncbi:hypothetical protein [Marinilabilia salmonicolor]|uniref:hypothetical protein n=1 Tax=Marinilabilia salmonicolor TaxID=989 RepID=UPI00029A9AC6|nr:hypothetical protein [Marinilabilia salmonicolor]